MPHSKIYQHVEKEVTDKKINLIKYDKFRQPPSELVDPKDIQMQFVKLWDDKIVNLSLLRNLEQYDEIAARSLMIELKQYVHNNVLKVYGLTYDGTSYFFVREYAATNLRDYLNSKGALLKWKEKLTLTSQIVNGLRFLHDRGVIHSDLNPKNIVMHEEIPKLTNIGMSQIRQSNEPSLSRYDPPEIWRSIEIKDKTKSNIYSLGLIMWEISSNGTEPFLNQNNIEFAIIDGDRELPIKGTPIKFIELYKKCWDNNSDNRPNCAKILEELKNVSSLEVYKIENPTGVRKSRPRTYVDTTCELNYEELLKANQLRAELINHFALNKGRNLDGFDFSPAKEFILHNNGDLKIDRVYMHSPTIYLPKSQDSPWKHLNNSSLFENQDKKIKDPKDDDVRIHVPVVTVKYTCKTATNEFVEKIRTALNSDSSEIKENLKKAFNDYGNYVAKKVTLGGVITIRNWSKVPAESRSYLRCYIQWAILYGKGGAKKIFEEIPLDRIPQLETYINMMTVGDLYTWFKSIYDLNFVDVISYEEVIPSYELLPDNLKNKIFKVLNFAPDEKCYISLIPNIPTDYEKQDILKWIIRRPPHHLYLSDWVQSNKLQHGVILQQLSLGHGKFAAFTFLREPEITEINKIIVSLIQPKTRQEAYLLENGIILKEEDALELDKIPFAEYSSTLNHPLEDFQHSTNKQSRTIYCQVSVNTVKISFNLSDIKALSDFSYAVNSALQSNIPFKNLCEQFGNNFGHLLSRTFTLGGTLSKKYEYTGINLPKNIVLEYDITDLQTPQNIKDKLKEWNEEFQDLDTTYFLNNDGDIINHDKIDDWLKDLFENRHSDWNVVASEDWTPLYKIMKKTHKNIDEMFDDRYHVVCNGEESLSRDQTTAIIKFPESLFDDKYYIYGVVVKKNINGNWEGIPKITVRFDYFNNNGCAAYIYKNCDMSLIQEDLKLLWFVLGSPKGFCSNINRSVKVTYGEFDVDHTQTMVKLTSKKLTSNCVLITSIVSRKDTVFYTIKPMRWSKTTINIEIQEDSINLVSDSEENLEDGYEDTGSDGEKDDFETNKKEQIPQEKVVLRWCIVDMDERGFIIGGGNIYPLSLFGDCLDEANEDFDDESIPIEPRFPPQMSLEDAIKQHTDPNGNTLEAWKTFVNLSRRGNFIADYWIGYYLQQDILKSKTLYEEDIEDVIQGEDTYVQAAMRYFQKAANFNYREAQLRYGFGLYYGFGVNKDRKEATRYFKLAAENNNPTAMYNLGVIWLFGDNKKEKEDGEQWLIKAARLGQSKAIEVCNSKNIKYRYP